MNYIAYAKELGFTEAAFFNPHNLNFDDADVIRMACEANDCGFYNKFWTCPPGVGSIEEVTTKIKAFKGGLVLQMLTEAISYDLNFELFNEVSSAFNDMTYLMKKMLSNEYGDVMMLGLSNCRLCPSCNYPEPCRHPKRMLPCVSGHCINIYRLWDSTGFPRGSLEESEFYSLLLW